MLSNGRTRGRGKCCLAALTCVSAYKGSNKFPEKCNFSSLVGSLEAVSLDAEVKEEEEEEKETEGTVPPRTSCNETLYFLHRNLNSASCLDWCFLMMASTLSNLDGSTRR